MNFLVDMPVSYQLSSWLNQNGHHAVHASEIGLFNAKDKDIVSIAKKQDRIIITADLDFPQILALSRATEPGIILFRGGSYSDQEMLALLKRVLDCFDAVKLSHAITVVDKTRIRRCPLPIE
jgi:predicted nuclease of predicted toxin-antitoxin system